MSERPSAQRRLDTFEPAGEEPPAVNHAHAARDVVVEGVQDAVQLVELPADDRVLVIPAQPMSAPLRRVARQTPAAQMEDLMVVGILQNQDVVPAEVPGVLDRAGD
jgi:hypothetical protein